MNLLIAVMLVLLSACGNQAGNATDPTERGLGLVAGAILTSAIIRAFFNK